MRWGVGALAPYHLKGARTSARRLRPAPCGYSPICWITPQGLLYRGLIVAAVIAAIGFYFITTKMMGDGVIIGGVLVTSLNLYYA